MMNLILITLLFYTPVESIRAFAIPRNATESDNQSSIFNRLLFWCSSCVLYQLSISIAIEILSLIVCCLITDLKVLADKARLILILLVLLANAEALGVDTLIHEAGSKSVLIWIAIVNHFMMTEFLWTMFYSSWGFYSLLKDTRSIIISTDVVYLHSILSFAVVRLVSKLLLLLMVMCPGLFAMGLASRNFDPSKLDRLLVTGTHQIAPSAFVNTFVTPMAFLLNSRYSRPDGITWAGFLDRQNNKLHGVTVVIQTLFVFLQFVTLCAEYWTLLRIILWHHLAMTAFLVFLNFADGKGFAYIPLQDERLKRVHSKFC